MIPCTIYTVIPLKNGRWSVKATVARTLFAQYREFQSKAAADAWIECHRRELDLPAQIAQINPNPDP
jgi:2-methylcitrate dehydratase PrpD